MKVLVVLSAFAALASCGVIEHHDSEGHKATSYQNIHIEHFHAVPTYIKKEDHHLLEHPVSKGKTSAEVKVHHGGKHDHGYAIASTHSDVHGHDEGGYDHHDLGHHVVSSGGGHHEEYQPHYEHHEEASDGGDHHHYQSAAEDEGHYDHHGYEGLEH